MSKVLEGLDGVVCQVDDVLVFRKDQAEHDTRVIAALEWIEKAGVTLNKDKCEFQKRQVKFLGHLIDAEGIRPDPEKTAALQDLAPPKSISELRRFMGMANQLGKFSWQSSANHSENCSVQSELGFGTTTKIVPLQTSRQS